MIKQNCLLCFMHYILLVGFNVPDSVATSVEQNLELSSNLKPKREIAGAAENLANYALDDLQKRVPKLFLGMRGKKIPSGFVGVRGRRLDSTYYPDQPMDWDSSPSNLDEDSLSEELMLEKRVPFSFMGVRGRKLPSGFVRVRGRRIPVAFLGMRGKKNEIYNENPNFTKGSGNDDKRTPRGFLGMRGKKDSLLLSGNSASDSLNFGAPKNFPFNELDQSSLAKRAPAAFLGMRG